MASIDLSKQDAMLRAEGQELLSVMNLGRHLSRFGEVVFGGSYVYRTMVDRDIDIALVTDDAQITPERVFMLREELRKIPYVKSVAVSDRKHYPKPNRPRGAWYGVVVDYKANLWNIDIWMINRDEKLSHHTSELHKQMQRITPSQRKVILERKYAALEAQNKQKGITSSQIYKNVLGGL